MAKKDDNSIWYVLLLCCAIMTIPLCIMCIKAQEYHRPAAEPNSLPSIIDIQRGLVEAGYDIGPHGIDGRLADCDTYRAWNQYQKDVLFNDYANQFMTPSGGPIEGE